MSTISYLAMFLIVGTIAALIYLVIDHINHCRKMDQLDADLQVRTKVWTWAKAGWVQQDANAEEQRRKEREEAEFQLDIDHFPRIYCSDLDPIFDPTFGIPVTDWRDELQRLVDRGVSLDHPSDEFSRIKKAVQRRLECNLEALSRSNDPAFRAEIRAAFGMARVHVADAQACLQHLNAIEAGWARDAMDQATDPAVEACQPVSRF